MSFTNQGYYALLRNLFFLLFIPFIGWGQNGLLYETYTVKDGLPSNQVYWTVQDKKGDLWICSDHGLLVFDGISMRTLTTHDDIPDNTIFKAFLDSNDRMWFTTRSHGVFWIEDDSIHIPAFNHDLMDKLGENWIDKIHFDEHDSLWLAGSKTSPYLYRAGINSKKVKEVEIKSDEVCMDAVYILKKKGKAIIAGGTSAQFYYSNPNCKENAADLISVGENEAVVVSHEFLSFLPPDPNTLTKIHLAHRVYFANNNDQLKWFSIRNILYSIDGTRLRQLKHFKSDILDIYKDDDYLIVSVANQGIFVYEPKGEELVLKGNYFRSSSISHIYKDKKGFYWLSMINKGLIKITSFDVNKLFIDQNLVGNRQIAKPWHFRNDSLMFISNDSLFIFVLDNQKFKLREVQKIGVNTETPNNVAWDNKNGLYFKLWRWDYKQRRVESFRNTPIAPRRIKVIGDGMVLYIGFNGYLMRDEDTTVFSSMQYKFTKSVRSILVEKDRHLIGTLDTLFEFKDGHYINLAEEYPQLGVRVEDIKKAENGDVWLATRGSGVCVLTRDTLFFITEEMGLNSNMVNNLWIDSTQIYASTNRGMNKIHVHEDGSIVVSSVLGQEASDLGFIDDLFKTTDRFIAQSGTAFIALGDKFLNSELSRPKVLFTTIEIGGVSYLNELDEAIKLSSNENSFEVSFRINSLKSESMPTKYKYRLVGLSPDWQTTFNSEVNFSSLKPATYEFEIMASDGSNKWSVPATINFAIMEPIYKRNWFVASLLLLGLGLTLLYFKLRQRQIERSKELIFANIRALKNQMNPHFIFNSLNSIQYYIATNQKREANIFLSKLSDLVRNVLTTSNRSLISVEEEVGRITDYLELEHMRLNKSFEYVIEVDEKIDIDQCQIPPMLIQPVAENAIWHGLTDLDYKGKLHINFSLDGENLIVTISDNGIGMDIEKWKLNPDFSGKGNSIGLSNILQRMRLMSKIKNKDYKIAFSNLEITPVKGTKITLTIPQ